MMWYRSDGSAAGSAFRPARTCRDRNALRRVPRQKRGEAERQVDLVPRQGRRAGRQAGNHERLQMARGDVLGQDALAVADAGTFHLGQDGGSDSSPVRVERSALPEAPLCMGTSGGRMAMA